MEKNVSSPKILNIVLCIIIIIVFVIFGASNVNAEEITKSDEVLPSHSITIGYRYRELIIEKQQDSIVDLSKNIIDSNKEIIDFYSLVFNYKSEEVINQILLNSVDEELKENNIGLLKNDDGNYYEFNNFEEGLIEYLFYLKKNNVLEKVNSYSYSTNRDYIEKLIIHFSKVYNNVDPTLMLSIGAAESGYYSSSYMLKKNNIYGGMSNGRLISYDNIEMGILSYIRMMSKAYYNKGLNNMYLIGKVYCPILYDNEKIASPHWIELVSKAMNNYKEISKDVSIIEIINYEK